MPIDFSSPGRMISVSKTSPKGHVCVFNANICTRSKGKIWFGDIDITSDADDLRKLAAKEGEEIYILREKGDYPGLDFRGTFALFSERQADAGGGAP